MPPSLLPRQDDGISDPSDVFVEPRGGTVSSVIISLVAITILSSFITQRCLVIKKWRKLPLLVWLVFAIFGDSWLFVFITAILKHGVGINSSFGLCSSGIILCLVCYVTTKLIYLFLVEKAFVVRNGRKRRLQSRLYLFNSFGMLTIYVVVSILNFIFRITRLDDGQCIIGMRRIAMIPLISFDVVVNVYLTMLFLIPLRSLNSFKGMSQTPGNLRLRTIAKRTFVSAVCTTISSVVNLTVLMVLDGEPAWVCLMCCNCDILFSAIVLQWVTSRDNAATMSSGNAGVPHRDSLRGTTTPPGQKSDVDRRASLDPPLQKKRSSSHIKSSLDDEMDVTEIPMRRTPDSYHSTEPLKKDDSPGENRSQKRRGSGFWGGEVLMTLDEEEEQRRKGGLEIMVLADREDDSGNSFTNDSRQKLRSK